MGAKNDVTHSEYTRMSPSQRMDYTWMPLWLNPAFNFDDGTPAGGATDIGDCR
jgi:hypothetical protein